MLEFAIVSGVVFFLILSLIDISRYALTQNVLTYAARQIADQAKVNPIIGKDVRWAKGMPNAQRFNEIRSQIINDVVGAGNLPYDARLLTYLMRDEFNPDPIDPISVPGSALLLMPGEVAYRVDSGKKVRILHPTCVSCQPYQINTLSSFEELRSKHGLYTQITAKLPLLVFGYREITVVGEALEWQEPDAGYHLGVSPETAEPTIQCRNLNAEEECAKAACDPRTETCTFTPGRFTPDCANCVPITCGAYWKQHETETGETFCTAAGCSNPKSCVFYENKPIDPSSTDQVSPCGNCGLGHQCKEFYTQAGLCEQLNCPASYSCRWYGARIITRNSVCAECISKSCRNRTTAEEACAPLRCEENNKQCYFKYWETSSTCAECIDANCEPPQGGCARGKVWSGRPKCTCCTYSTCASLNNPRRNIKYVFDSRQCKCVKQPDDSTGDLK